MRVSLPLQLIAIIAFAVLAGHLLPVGAMRASYTFSLVFKEILGAFLPLIVFSFVIAGVLSFKKNAPLILSLLMGSIVLSNAVVSLFAYGIGRLIVPVLTKNLDLSSCGAVRELVPFFSIKLPPFIASEKALFAALLFGTLLSFFSLPQVERGLLRLKVWVEIILNRLFIPLLPLYVLGFLLQIQYEGVFATLFRSYGSTFVCIVGLHFIYLALYYWVAAHFSKKQATFYFKNAVPSYLTAFSTLSSTATIPVTINSAVKNTGNRALANVAVPIMANVHLVGDGISTPLLALVTMQVFLGFMPDLLTYAIFVGYFCLTMLATSGVPGGGIIVMIPILKSQLGFTPEMISIITTLYLLQDAFGTAGNVTGDGALMIIIDKMLRRLGLTKAEN